MWGQWIGKFKYSDENHEGVLVLNIDRDRLFEGHLMISDVFMDVPKIFCSIKIEHLEGGKFKGVLDNFNGYDRSSGRLISGNQSDILASKGEVIFEDKDDALIGEWKSDNERKGTFSIKKQEKVKSSERDQMFYWDDFKVWAQGHKRDKPNAIFRGHKSNKNALITSFHRAGRCDIVRYSDEDILTLDRHTSSIIHPKFDLTDPIDHGSLINLAQHHGFPTPLLDWTESPYVAAFFAFYELEKKQKEENEFARIFVLDRDAWSKKFSPVTNIQETLPSFWILNLYPRLNPRALPQQSVVTFSNNYNIESYIRYYERKAKRGLTPLIALGYSISELLRQHLQQCTHLAFRYKFPWGSYNACLYTRQFYTHGSHRMPFEP